MSTTSSPTDARLALRVDVTARALVRTWRLAVFATVCFVGVWLTLMALAVAVDRLLYVPLFAMMTVASAYNVRRFLPRVADDGQPSTVGLAPRDAAVVRTRLGAGTDVDVPEQIRLTADSAVRIGDDGSLHVGLPVAMCLDAADVGVLVEDAALAHTLVRTPAAASARRIAEGRLGRGLRDGPQRTSKRLLARLDARATDFYEALDECVQAARVERFAAWAPTLTRHGLVVEAWWVVLHRWVVPALGQGHLSVTPFTGVRDLLAAATELGITEEPAVAATPLLTTAQAGAYEEAVARTLTVRPDDFEEVTWVEHAPTVLVPAWRRTVARGLVAVARAVGQPRPATLGTFVEVLEEGWADSLTASLADPLGDPDRDADVVPDLLAAATWLAGLDVPGTRVSWRWPFGPALELPDGQVLDAAAFAATAIDELSATGSMAEFRLLAGHHGIDLDGPIWLDEGTGPESDRVIASVVANTGWRKNVVLVLSERALRVFEDSYVESTRRDLSLQMVGPHETLQPLMDAVEDGEAGESTVVVQVRDVVHAELSSVLGGMYWRLRLWTAEGRFRIFGGGAPGIVEDVLQQLLGDRLTTRWLHLPTRLQTVRYWTTALLVGLGVCLLLSGPVAWPMGAATIEDALATSVIGLAVLLLVMLPGAVLTALHSRRRHAGRRRTPEVR